MWHDGRPPSPSWTSMSFSAAFAHEKVQCISCVLCNFWNPYNVILAFLFSLSGKVKKKHSVIKRNDFYNTCWLLHSTFCQSSAESEFVLLLLWTQIPGNSSCIFFFVESLPWRWQPWEYAVIIIEIPASFLDCWPRFVLPWHNKQGVTILNLARRCIVRKHNVKHIIVSLQSIW